MCLKFSAFKNFVRLSNEPEGTFISKKLRFPSSLLPVPSAAFAAWSSHLSGLPRKSQCFPGDPQGPRPAASEASSTWLYIAVLPHVSLAALNKLL